MNVAISLEDSLVEQVDTAARELALTRNEWIAAAIKDHLRQREQARITAQLNESHNDGPTPEERRIVSRLKSKLPIADRW